MRRNMRPRPPVCSHCGRSHQSMMTCSRCKAAIYCSKECQRAAWSRHKRDCWARAEGGPSQAAQVDGSVTGMLPPGRSTGLPPQSAESRSANVVGSSWGSRAGSLSPPRHYPVTPLSEGSSGGSSKHRTLRDGSPVRQSFLDNSLRARALWEDDMRVIAKMARAGDEADGMDAGLHSQRSPTRADFASTGFLRDHELRERQWELEDQVEMLQSELKKERARLELERKRGETERQRHQKLQDQIKQLHFDEHKWRVRNENTAFFPPSSTPNIVPDGSRWNSAPAPMTTTTSPEDAVYAVASLRPSCHAPELLSKRCLQFFTHPTLVCLSVCFICVPTGRELEGKTHMLLPFSRPTKDRSRGCHRELLHQPRQFAASPARPQ